MRLRVVAVMTLVVLFALTVVACGVPRSGKFASIDPNNIPPALIETTTIQPTTTTTVAEESTTTTIELPSTTEQGQHVTLYFVSGQQVSPYDQIFPLPGNDFVRILEALRDGPAGPLATGLRTAIPTESQFKTSKERGVLTVEVNDAFLDTMAPQDQRLAMAQIVLTLTQLQGVGAVTFTNNDEPTSVFLWSGEPSTPDQKLNYEDYVNALVTSPPPATTSTTTTATPPADPTASSTA